MRALVLSGGGFQGAYQAGVLEVLLGERRTVYDLYAGTSIGAMHAAFLGQFSEGQEQAASRHLSELWRTIRRKDVWKPWFPFGRLHGLWKPSLYDSRPLRELIADKLDLGLVKSSGKLVRVGAVSLNSGESGVWTERDDDLAEGVYSSAAYPIYFGPGRSRDQMWTDWGIREINPIAAAVDAGADSIDVISTFSGKVRFWEDENPNVLTRAFRELEIMLDEIQDEDLRTCEKALCLRVIRPSDPLDIDPLDPKEGEIEAAMARGRADALHMLDPPI